MKIYVSEKEIKSINNTFADVYEKNSDGFFKTAVPIKSLEQHYKELVESLYSYLLKPKSWRLMKSAWADDEHSPELKELLEEFLKERGIE